MNLFALRCDKKYTNLQSYLINHKYEESPKNIFKVELKNGHIELDEQHIFVKCQELCSENKIDSFLSG